MTPKEKAEQIRNSFIDVTKNFHELPFEWAPGHIHGTAIHCNTCWKLLQHNNNVSYNHFMVTSTSDDRKIMLKRSDYEGLTKEELPNTDSL